MPFKVLEKLWAKLLLSAEKKRELSNFTHMETETKVFFPDSVSHLNYFTPDQVNPDFNLVSRNFVFFSLFIFEYHELYVHLYKIFIELN